MKQSHPGRKLSLSVFLLIALLFLFIQGIGVISARSEEEQKRSLEEAIHRNIVHCYTENGFYPESLDYLLRNYPIFYDKSRYVIHYQPVASNLMPDVTVTERSRTR